MVRRQGTDANTKGVTPLRHVIEVGYAMSKFNSMVIGEEMPERAKTNVFRPPKRLSE